ncbi:MAG: phage tail-like protein [Halioglobus sp.]|jgi:phage tail-like protein
MSETVASQRTQYPLVAYNFRVTVGETSMGFAEVSGLVREYQTLTYSHGLSFWEGETITKYRYDTYSEVTLTKGIIAGVHSGVKTLYQWLDSVDKKSLTVDLCDEQGKPVVTWRIQKAMVVKLEAPTFDASSNEVAIDTLTLMASGISVKYQ